MKLARSPLEGRLLKGVVVVTAVEGRGAASAGMLSSNCSGLCVCVCVGGLEGRRNGRLVLDEVDSLRSENLKAVGSDGAVGHEGEGGAETHTHTGTHTPKERDGHSLFPRTGELGGGVDVGAHGAVGHEEEGGAGADVHGTGDSAREEAAGALLLLCCFGVIGVGYRGRGDPRCDGASFLSFQATFSQGRTRRGGMAPPNMEHTFRKTLTAQSQGPLYDASTCSRVFSTSKGVVTQAANVPEKAPAMPSCSCKQMCVLWCG